jgi:iron complex outermembrane receptor protein
MKFYLILFSLLISSLTFAQEEKDSLKYETEELIITGTRSFEKIIDIPYSVFRVDKNELTFGKKVSAKDVLADVPGLFLQSMFGTSDLRISIRGFGTRSNSGVRGVRILQDGIPESEPDGETVIDAVDFSSLGGVEVVKGNLSSLYANAPGGVVNFLSDLYFTQNYTTSVNQFGSYGLRKNGFKLGLKTDDYRYFLSYSYRNTDGFRSHGNEYTHLINSVYEGYLGTKSTISILGNYVNGLTRSPGALTPAEFSADPFQANPLALAFDYKRQTEKGRLGVKFKTSFGKYNNNEIEVTGYGGLSDLIKTDNINYTYSTRYSLGSLLRFTNRSKLFGRNNTLSLGMDYAYQSGPVTDFENLNGQRGISINDEYNAYWSNLGFYFLNQINLYKDKCDLFLSGRFDKNAVTRDLYSPYGYIDTFRVFQQFTPKIALNYKITPSIALYTSYGSGYDIPALSELNNTPFSSNINYTLNPDLVPQKSDNYELGIKGNILNRKSEFMRKVYFDVTYFNYTISDEIVPFSVGQQVYFRNAAKTNRQGIEVGFSSEPFEGVELTTNYTITNFKYKDYKATIYSSGPPVVEDYSGNYVPAVPQHIFNFILNYEFEISDDLSGLLQWDNDYITKMYANDNNSVAAPSYFYGNSMAGLNYQSKRFGIVAFVGVNNIFDKRYVGFVNINDVLGRYFQAGEPRNFYSGLNFTYKY